MAEGSAATAAIDLYIAQFPDDVQTVLRELRAAIHAAAPDAVEIFSYQMPGFHLHGRLVWFAAYKRHIGFYPTPAGIAAFQAELAPYKQSKGAVQFPLDRPLPLDLIAAIVRYRAAENRAKTARA